MKHTTSFNNFIKKGTNYKFRKFETKEIRSILEDPEFFELTEFDTDLLEEILFQRTGSYDW
tara:strand:- start:2 stop:184 length:183 start_codon:yes stop_codon:yes gene_type:complete